MSDPIRPTASPAPIEQLAADLIAADSAGHPTLSRSGRRKGGGLVVPGPAGAPRLGPFGYPWWRWIVFPIVLIAVLVASMPRHA